MTNRKPHYRNVIPGYFNNLISKYGDDVRSVDWGSEESQEQRFNILHEVGVKKDSSVLDVGCGRGDYYRYLITRGFGGRYHGVDITPSMIDISRKRFADDIFEVRDVLIKRYPELSFEYVIASGIFYLEILDNPSFFRNMVKTLYSIAKKGFAFNCLSAFSDVKVAGEFYFQPEDVMKFCQTITPYVSLRHDYRANDFTIHMKNKNE